MNKKHLNNQGGPGGFTRRHFIKSTAALGALALLGPTSQVFGANDRMRIAVCGVRSRGNHLMRRFADEDNVEIAWIVDPDRRLLEQRSEEIKERSGKKPKTTTDLRKALEDPDVDAIVVGSPNHWHSLMVIWAAQAGKHCFVEKPASHQVHEGRVALEAAGKYGVVVQHGTQRRSSEDTAGTIKAIHSGKYGKLAISHCIVQRHRNHIGHEPVSEPPDWLDWDLWRGPAVIDEFHRNLVHYNWHWFWATGNGEVNNQGTHQLDVAYWALDPEMHSRHPMKITALGGRFGWDDQAETPNALFGMAEYPNGQKIVMSCGNGDYEGFRRQVENRFYFEDGGRIVGNEYISPDGEKSPVEAEPSGITGGGHVGSFVRACRAGDPGMANGNMQDAHYSCVVGHLFNIAYRIGKEVPFNAKAGRFGDDSKTADLFLDFHERVRDGWALPEDEEKYLVGPSLSFDSDSETFAGEHAGEANPLLRDPRREEFEIPEPDRV